jgi:hypothetical protein
VAPVAVHARGGTSVPVFETFTADNGGRYQLIVDDSNGQQLARPVGGGGAADVPFADFPRQEWRTWAAPKSNTEGGGTTARRTDVPGSTADVPTTLYKRVNVEHVDSIAREGLATTAERVVFHGYSAGTPYLARDVALLAVWLSTDGQPGESMQPDKGAWIDLSVDVSPMFRELFLRDVRAVLHGSDTTNSNTVLSFAPIPPTRIFLTTPEHVVERAKRLSPDCRLQTARTPLAKIGAGDIRDLVKAALELQKEGTLHQDNSW